MNWRRLNREQSLSVLEAVKSAAEAGLFAPASCEVEMAVLPFYKTYSLYKITNFASLPSFTFEFLGDGQFFHYLDTSSDPILAVNDKGELSLNDLNVADYLVFYFSHVILEDGEECFFIKDPYDLPQMKSLDPDSVRAVLKNHQPPVITALPGGAGFSVVAGLYVDGQVARATIEVKDSGRVTITDQTMMMNYVTNNALETIA